MTLEIQQPPNNRKPRSFTELATELKRVAGKGSTRFYQFWDGMSYEERRLLIRGEETRPAGGR